MVSFNLGSLGRQATAGSVKSADSSDVKEKGDDGYPVTTTKEVIITEDELVEGGLTFEQGTSVRDCQRDMLIHMPQIRPAAWVVTLVSSPARCLCECPLSTARSLA